MARAIFKSWFVDFDPFQGMPPEDWKLSSIGEVVSVVGGATPSTAEPDFWNGPYHFATPKDMASLTAPVLLTTERTITEEGLAYISSGLLPPGTVLLSSRAPIGYLAISEIPVSVNQGFIAMVCDDLLPNFYVIEWARHNMEVIIGHANGTTFLEISKRNFRPIPILVPSQPVLSRFVGLVGPLYRQIAANLKEANTLAALRDALLPKLLSGEIRVKQAEKIVGEAV
jgi:type I restriction enzyme, S subunit